MLLATLVCVVESGYVATLSLLLEEIGRTTREAKVTQIDRLNDQQQQQRTLRADCFHIFLLILRKIKSPRNFSSRLLACGHLLFSRPARHLAR